MSGIENKRQAFIASHDRYKNNSQLPEEMYQKAGEDLQSFLNESLTNKDIDSVANEILKDKELNKILVQGQFGSIMLQDCSMDLQAAISTNYRLKNLEAENFIDSSTKNGEINQSEINKAFDTYRDIGLNDRKIAATIFDHPKTKGILEKNGNALQFNPKIQEEYNKIIDDKGRVAGNFLSSEQIIAKESLIGLFESAEKNNPLNELDEQIKTLETKKGIH